MKKCPAAIQVGYQWINCGADFNHKGPHVVLLKNHKLKKSKCYNCNVMLFSGCDIKDRRSGICRNEPHCGRPSFSAVCKKCIQRFNGYCSKACALNPL